MSILTKVFVVLVAVLSVALMAMIVPFAANTENFKQRIDQLESDKAALENIAQVRQNDLGSLQDAFNQQVTSLKSQNQTLTAQILSLTDRLAQAEAQVRDERTSNAQFKVSLGRLTASNEQHAQITSQLQDELKRRRKEVLDQKTRSIQLADRNNELQIQLDAITRQDRQLREQVTQLEEQNTELEEKFTQLPPEWRTRLSDDYVATAPFVPATQITGHVTGVDQLEDETFVQVNVGSNDGVAPNMKFLVHRGTQFLGSLIITAVDAQVSAGRLDLPQGTVVIGDGVLAGGY